MRLEKGRELQCYRFEETALWCTSVLIDIPDTHTSAWKSRVMEKEGIFMGGFDSFASGKNIVSNIHGGGGFKSIFFLILCKYIHVINIRREGELFQ